MQVKPQVTDLTKPSDYKIFIPLLLIYGLALAYSNFLGLSFWLDECISAWASSDDFSSAISRSWQYQGQSPLYYVLLSLWIKLFGTSEIAIRSMSLCCLIIASSIIFIWIKNSLTASAAFIAVIIFISQDPTQLALSARPYALGILFSILSIRSIINFANDSNKHALRSLSAYIIFGALAIYAHYFAALSIFAAGLIVFFFGGYNNKKQIKLLVAAIIILLLCSPLLSHIKHLQNKASEVSFAPEMTISQIFAALLPAFPVLAIIIACTACASIPRIPIQKIFNRQNHDRLLLFVAAAWWILPIIFLIALSLLSGSTFLLSRYLSFATPAFAILVAIGFFLIEKSHQRAVAIVLISLLALREINRSWTVEDWRTAIHYASETSSPILLSSGLAEANHLNWLQSDSIATQQYLISPLLVYNKKLTGHAIPSTLIDPQLRSYSANEITKSLSSTNQTKIVLYDRDNYLKQISQLLTELGLTFTQKNFGIVKVLDIKKTPEAI